MQKTLQLPFFLFFSFSFSSVFFQLYKISYQWGVWRRSDSFLGHTKKYFSKTCFSSCYSGRVWHMTRLIHGNQHLQHPKKHKKWPETRKQVIQLVWSRWMKIQASKQKETELISKEVWRKKEGVQKKQWIGTPYETI